MKGTVTATMRFQHSTDETPTRISNFNSPFQVSHGRKSHLPPIDAKQINGEVTVLATLERWDRKSSCLKGHSSAASRLLTGHRKETNNYPFEQLYIVLAQFWLHSVSADETEHPHESVTEGQEPARIYRRVNHQQHAAQSWRQAQNETHVMIQHEKK